MQRPWNYYKKVYYEDLCVADKIRTLILKASPRLFMLSLLLNIFLLVEVKLYSSYTDKLFHFYENEMQSYKNVEYSYFKLEERHIELEKTTSKVASELKAIKEQGVEKVILNRGIRTSDIYKVIYNTMLYLGEENPHDFAHLLEVTHLAESDGGQYLFQMNNGIAQGIFQVEPETESEVFRVFLARNPEWKEKIEALKGIEVQGLENNVYNLAYNTAIAWCVYKWRIPEGTPPNKNDKQKQAEYHKQYYNTIHGDATVEGTLAKL